MPPELDKALTKLRMHDAARVSREQLISVGDALRRALPGPDRRPIVIAALHHHLFPVSLAEEVKSFETMTNVAALRQFLADNHVDIVLHGHKHVPNVYENVVDLAPFDENSHRHRLLVCSAGTIGQGHAHGMEIAKLIEIDDDLPTLPRITIVPLAAVGPSAQLVRLTARQVERRIPTDEPVRKDHLIIRGRTTEDVHTQLLAHFHDYNDALVLNLGCVVEDGPSALMRPSSYPELGDHPLASDPDTYFSALVDWWQNGQIVNGKPFTHGQRIKAWANVIGRDQLVDVANTLLRDSTSSRGLVALFEPDRDQIADIPNKFPAFVLAHFFLQDAALHVVGVFRKQEMRYWWPINAAELAEMQARVVDLMNKQGRTVQAGSLTTFATQAKAGTAIPWVAVPAIDQLVWDDPSNMWSLAAAVAAPDMGAKRASFLAQIHELMMEWRPADQEAADGAPAAGPGLRHFDLALVALGETFGRTKAVRRFHELLELMQVANREYRLDDAALALPYAAWRDRTRAYIDEFCQLLTSWTVG